MLSRHYVRKKEQFPEERHAVYISPHIEWIIFYSLFGRINLKSIACWQVLILIQFNEIWRKKKQQIQIVKLLKNMIVSLVPRSLLLRTLKCQPLSKHWVYNWYIN